MSEPQKPDSGRRDFLGATAAATAAGLGFTVLAPGMQLIKFAEANTNTVNTASAATTHTASAKVRWGMLIDTARCATGCTDCVTACATENAIQPGSGRPGQSSQWIRKIELKEQTTGREISLPMMCQHCADAPCVDVCPTGASFKRADGIVLVDRHSCIGCRYCMMACPYKARSFVHEELTQQNPEVPRGKGCVESCTLCVHRVDKGQQPACVEACSKGDHTAMLFGDLNNPSSEIAKRIATTATSQVRADLRLDPGVRFQGI